MNIELTKDLFEKIRTIECLSDKEVLRRCYLIAYSESLNVHFSFFEKVKNIFLFDSPLTTVADYKTTRYIKKIDNIKKLIEYYDSYSTFKNSKISIDLDFLRKFFS